MKKRLHKYSEFKLLLEKGRNDNKRGEFNTEEEENSEENEFNFDNVDNRDLDEEDSEGGDDMFNFDEDDNKDDGGDDFDFDGDRDSGEDEEEVPVEKVFNEDPGYYVEQALKKVERKLTSLFEEPETDENGKTNKDPSSYHSQGVELMDVKTTDLAMNKTLIMKYHDDDFTYHLMVTIDLQQGIPEKGDVEMDHSMVEFCGVKFKKYDVSNKLLGELDRKKVKLDTIDQDFIDSLNGELDGKYSIDDNFEIEYGKSDGEEDSEEDSNEEDKENTDIE
tara:strand:- start:29076 stop:29906 length:831 start_codon:yes stop_codon:yes gene_type:complete